MSAFTKEEEIEFIRLLRKVKDNNYYFPGESFEVFEEVISRWASELVITRVNKAKAIEILLAVYNGGIQRFKGMWHIPGGRDYWPAPDIQTDCSLIAMREIGVDVRFIKVIDGYKWRGREHPHGHPLSLYVECLPRGKVKETETLKFFPVDRLPSPIVQVQERWIRKFFR